jgi:hypothetical protein
MQDYSVYEEVRDDTTFTPYAAAGVAIAALLAGIGAWLWAETINDYTPHGWFVDTVIIGTLFTMILFAAGIAAMYFLLTQVLRETVPTLDGFIRVAALGHVSYAAALLVFIPEFGFAFGLLAVAFVYFDTVTGIKSAYPSVSMLNTVAAVTAGVAVWLVLLPIITASPDNNWVTGPFVYSLFE